jgi:hypothetical protein
MDWTSPAADEAHCGYLYSFSVFTSHPQWTPDFITNDDDLRVFDVRQGKVTGPLSRCRTQADVYKRTLFDVVLHASAPTILREGAASWMPHRH